jgi:4,5-dihydroxyphthalate decarboxylase
VEKVALELPPGVRLTPVPDRPLDQMLVAGDLDAIVTAHPPASFKARQPGRRAALPGRPRGRGGVLARHRHLPDHARGGHPAGRAGRAPVGRDEPLPAIEAAKRRSTARALDWRAPRLPVPWVVERAARARALFGEDFWPYGVEANRPTLEAFLRFASEQGVAHRPLHVDELFPPEVRSTFRA